MRIETLAEGVTLILGDCLERMAEIESNSIDSCVTDPPYHLTSGKKGGTGIASLNENSPAGRSRVTTGFMGKAWDGGKVAFQVETWKAVYRVLKPGAHLVAFGGTRTYHRMACAIEDAGFEIRDQMQWLYGSGFPKSHDVSKGIDRAACAEREVIGGGRSGKRELYDGPSTGRSQDFLAGEYDYTAPATDAARQWSGFGTALKPACEPIVLARKPLSEGTVAANVLKWGTGALNIDGCRVSTEGEHIHTPQSDPKNRTGVVGTDLGITRSDSDRFKASQVESINRTNTLGRWPANLLHDGSPEVVEGFPDAKAGGNIDSSAPSDKTDTIFGTFTGRFDNTSYGDSGSAARFFYTAKADSDDRLGSKHPTVKPLDLMQWLVRLVTPPKGIVLDPFAGTGTTGEAAFREGFRAILIEREEEYQNDIRRRMKLAMCGPDERARESIKARMKDKPVDHGPLFGGAESARGGADRFTASSPTKDRPDRAEILSD